MSARHRFCLLFIERKVSWNERAVMTTVLGCKMEAKANQNCHCDKRDERLNCESEKTTVMKAHSHKLNDPFWTASVKVHSTR